jgi:D-alanyl-D-alanine carboxypeptidase
LLIEVILLAGTIMPMFNIPNHLANALRAHLPKMAVNIELPQVATPTWHPSEVSLPKFEVSLPKKSVESTKSSEPEASSEPAKSSSSSVSSTTQKLDLPDVPASSWMLIDVSKMKPLKKDLDIQLVDVEGVQVDSRIKMFLEGFLQEGRAMGYQYDLVSGYRSVASQTKIYNDSIAKHEAEGLSEAAAKTETEKTINPPGSSEHATGLAVDIAGTDALNKYPNLQAEMDQFESQQWLINNAYRYGFIMRYPNGRQDETGITYESWHFRYVGKEVAKYIYDHDLTLEEYLKLLKEN